MLRDFQHPRDKAQPDGHRACESPLGSPDIQLVGKRSARGRSCRRAGTREGTGAGEGASRAGGEARGRAPRAPPPARAGAAHPQPSTPSAASATSAAAATPQPGSH